MTCRRTSPPAYVVCGGPVRQPYVDFINQSGTKNLPSGLLQQFHVCPAGERPPSEDYTYILYFLFLMPKPFKVILRHRSVWKI